MIIIYILTIIFVILVISLFVYNYKGNNIRDCIEKDINSHYDPNTKKCVCNDGYTLKNGKCIKIRPDQPTKYCPVTSVDSLVVCNPDDINSCSDCTGEGNIFYCQKVDKDIELNGQKIPFGNYCMPLSQEPSANCDEKIGYQVLSYDEQNKAYYWACLSKYPNMFEINPTTGDYIQIACSGSKILCDNGNEWNDPQNGCDPASKGAKCDCPSGLMYVDDSAGDIYIKNCITNTCYPGTTNPNQPGNCICTSTTIQCPEAVTNSVIKERCIGNPQCLPDPCQPGGSYDYQSGGKCNCNEQNGYYNIPNTNSIIGYSCGQPCQNNGPCGNRGTCQYQDGNLSCQCNSDYGPDQGNPKLDPLCSYHLIPNNGSCENDWQCQSGNCAEITNQQLTIYRCMSKDF